MELRNKSILIISPEAWGTNFVSKHHYALILSKNKNQVFFLNPPSNGFGFHNEQEGVVVVDYKAQFRGLRFLPMQIQKLLMRTELNRLERNLKTSFDIIWNFDCSRFYNLEAISKDIFKICHIVDLNQKVHRPTLAKTSNICFGTTRYIVDDLKKFNSNVFKIPHAYQQDVLAQDPLSYELPGSNTIKALYVGNLSMKYIDWNILNECAIKFPFMDFIFVGPEGKSNLSQHPHDEDAKQKIQELPNVYFEPPQPASRIPALLLLADLLLIAYKEEHHKDQAAPHKMNEYLASGKPIAATFTEEYQGIKANNLFMSKKNRELTKLIEKALAYERKPDTIGFRPYTYEEIIKQIEEFIEKTS